jgi:hypothetical protein
MDTPMEFAVKAHNDSITGTVTLKRHESGLITAHGLCTVAADCLLTDEACQETVGDIVADILAGVGE